MADISIDPDLCTGCGVCTTSCPYMILRLNVDDNIASVTPEAAAFCNNCGHCGAICPVQAITVKYTGAGPIPDAQNSALPDPGQIGKLFISRRSVRAYKNKQVPRRVFEDLFDIVRYAPSGMNGQSVGWLVMENPEDVKKFVQKIVDWARLVVKEQPNHLLAPLLPMVIHEWDQGSDKFCHGAPHLIFAYGHKDNPVSYIDSIIAMTHLDLAAPVFGLGTCWAGIVQIALNSSPELMQSIGLPQDHVSHYAMMIGYPAHAYSAIPARNSAKVTWK
jgi:nitroreductase/NAD-dependent dihydropyrimidine dehydrogenase PreA subunit